MNLITSGGVCQGIAIGNQPKLTAEGVRGQFAPKGYALILGGQLWGGTPLMGAELRRGPYGLRGAGITLPGVRGVPSLFSIFIHASVRQLLVTLQ